MTGQDHYGEKDIGKSSWIMYITDSVSQPGLRFSIGERALRRKYTWGEYSWVEFTVNSTYMELIKEFPEDYRKL
jgi:hypothetical protein